MSRRKKISIAKKFANAEKILSKKQKNQNNKALFNDALKKAATTKFKAMSNHSLSHGYEIKTAIDFFKKLLDEREDFLKQPTSSRYAMNCALTAWHLHDWIYHDYKGNDFIKQFSSKKKFQDWLLYQLMEFSLVRDLADGTKHFKLDRIDTIVLETQLMREGENIGHHKVKKDTLFVMMKYLEGGRESFDDILHLTTHFWYKFMSEKLGIDTSKIINDGEYSYF